MNRDDCPGVNPDGYPDGYRDANDCDVLNGDHGLLNGGNASDFDFDGNCYGNDYDCFYYYDVCRLSAYLRKNDKKLLNSKIARFFGNREFEIPCVITSIMADINHYMMM